MYTILTKKWERPLLRRLRPTRPLVRKQPMVLRSPIDIGVVRGAEGYRCTQQICSVYGLPTVTRIAHQKCTAICHF